MVEYDHWRWMNSNPSYEPQHQQEAGSPELSAYLNQYLELTNRCIEETDAFLVRMDRRNDISILQTEPPKSSIEVITRLVVTEEIHDTQMYESQY